MVVCLHPAALVRKAMRLEDFDYSSNGAYFITICTYRRQWLLTGSGLEIAQRELAALPVRFVGLALDRHRFMPDHLHAVIHLSGCESTLSAIVQAYKSITAREITLVLQCRRIWQRGFYDRIVRDETELAALREYIEHNDIVHDEAGGWAHGGAEQAPPLRSGEGDRIRTVGAALARPSGVSRATPG